MQIRFWGVRGSIPAPGPATVRYGGNTSCVEVRADDGTLLVLDCGSGARELGQSLLAEGDGGGAPRAVLVGHTHWDHIQGLPFFAPFFVPGQWSLFGPRGLGQSLADTLAGQMQYTYFPVTPDNLTADVSYNDLVEGVFEIGDVRVTTQYLNHPALTLGYRIEADGHTVVYAADHEPFDPTLADGGDLSSSAADARHVEFLAGADVVIHDAQYLAAEYPQKVGWGHSTMEYVVDAGVAAGAGRTVLFHHDPARDDGALDVVLEGARARAAAVGYDGSVEAAAEGAVIDLGRRVRSGRPSSEQRSAVLEPAIDDLAEVAVVAVDDPMAALTVADAVQAEQLPVERWEGEREAIGARAVVIGERDADGGPLDAVVECCEPGTAVLGLTRSLPAPPSPEVTDWIVWPASVAHVRTKVRAAVLRRACRWQAAPLPPDEDRRLEALRGLDVLDTEPEERFDRLTQLAQKVLGVPIALVSLIDAERQWFKSRAGLDIEETPRDMAVCAHAILEDDDVFLVPDLLLDPRFADNPAVQGDARVRAYAGVPLEAEDGSRVGTFCVIDHRPRDFDDEQLDELRRIAAEVQAELRSPRPVVDTA